MLRFLSLFLLGLTTYAPVQAQTTDMASTSQTAIQNKTFTNSDRGYTIQYPNNWTKRTDVKGFDIFIMAPEESDGRSLANFSIISETFNGTLEAYVKKNVQALLKDDPSTKITSQGISQIGGVSAAWIKYAKGDVNAQITQYLFVTNGYGYTVTTAVAKQVMSKYGTTVDAIVKSFKFQ